MGDASPMMKLVPLLLCFLLPHVLAMSNLTADDVHRAVTQVPRPQFRSKTNLAAANQVLNGHLVNMNHLKTRACETFSALDLEQLSRLLYGAADEALLVVYAEAEDNRRQIYSSMQAMEADFARLNELVRGRDDLHDTLRDGLCHRVVMWF